MPNILYLWLIMLGFFAALQNVNKENQWLDIHLILELSLLSWFWVSLKH